MNEEENRESRKDAILDGVIKIVECLCIVVTSAMTCYFLWSLIPMLTTVD